MTDDVVKQLRDKWGNRAYAADVTVDADGLRHFDVGSHTVTIPTDPDQPILTAHKYRSWSSPKDNPIPNMHFTDGEMVIPIEDILDLLLRRVPADELAEGLWKDESVRRCFINNLLQDYGSSIDDDERRMVLDKMQKPIYAKSLDRAITRLNEIESNLRAKSHRNRWEQAQYGHYTGIYTAMRELQLYIREKFNLGEEEIPWAAKMERFMTPERFGEWIKDAADPVTQESVGQSWTESRNFWREKLLEAFPEPPKDFESDREATVLEALRRHVQALNHVNSITIVEKFLGVPTQEIVKEVHRSWNDVLKALERTDQSTVVPGETLP